MLKQALEYHEMLLKYYKYAPATISIAGVRAMFKTIKEASNDNPKLKAVIEKHISEQEET